MRVITLGKFEREYYEATGKIKPESKSAPFVKNKKLTESLNKIHIPVDIIPMDHKSIIFLGRNGKRDIVGSYLNPIENYTGIHNSALSEHHVHHGDWECDLYDVGKFAKLLINGDYEFIKILWLNKLDTIYSSNIWDCIVNNRSIFITTKVHQSFKRFLKLAIIDLYEKRNNIGRYTISNIQNNLLLYREMIQSTESIKEANNIAGSINVTKILSYIDRITRNSRVMKKSIDLMTIDKIIKEQSKIWYKNNI